jgi:hypothetical protein
VHVDMVGMCAGGPADEWKHACKQSLQGVVSVLLLAHVNFFTWRQLKAEDTCVLRLQVDLLMSERKEAKEAVQAQADTMKAAQVH